MNDDEIFRLILNAIFIDVQGNEFKHDTDYSHKLSSLAMIVKLGAKDDRVYMAEKD